MLRQDKIKLMQESTRIFSTHTHSDTIMDTSLHRLHHRAFKMENQSSILMDNTVCRTTEQPWNFVGSIKSLFSILFLFSAALMKNLWDETTSLNSQINKDVEPEDWNASGRLGKSFMRVKVSGCRTTTDEPKLDSLLQWMCQLLKYLTPPKKRNLTLTKVAFRVSPWTCISADVCFQTAVPLATAAPTDAATSRSFKPLTILC